MDIKLNEDQLEIARQARRFCENESPMDYVRAMFEDQKGYTDEVWTKIVEMGWTAMNIPEAYDGIEMELMDLAVVMEEMGRAVFPGPFFSSAALAAEILAETGSEEQRAKYLTGMAFGSTRGTLALSENESGCDLNYIGLPAAADGDGFKLNGAKITVPDAHTADFLICAARTSGSPDSAQGVTLFLVDLPSEAVKITELTAMDGTRKQCAVEFNDLRLGSEAVVGAVNQGRAPLDKALQRAQVALSAECVGGAQRCMEIATDYSKERVQFDQPIAAFQAIKHMCAQMFVEVESARSLVYWAAWAQDHADENEAALAASTAKVYCTDAFRNAASNTVQVLGGTGFTWEHDIHLYLKRAKCSELTLGDQAWHRERVVGLLEG